MNMLANLKTDDSIHQEADVIMTSGPLDSGLYPATVALAYLGKSNGGATSLTLHLKINGREVRKTLWMASGDAKGNRNYYTSKTGEKHYLPGFNVANSLCLLTIGKEIGELEPEEKTVNLFNFDAKAEVPTKVPVLTELLGQEVLVGLIRQTVDKNVKDANGTYVPSGEVRDENEIDKIFRARDRMTTAEVLARAEHASFADTWEEKFTGVTRNRAKGAAAGAAQGSAGIPGSAPAASPAAGKPTASLFS